MNHFHPYSGNLMNENGTYKLKIKIIYVLMAIAIVIALFSIVVYKSKEYYARWNVFNDIKYNVCLEGSFFEQDKDGKRFFPVDCSKLNMPFIKIDNELYLVSDTFYYCPLDKDRRRIQSTPESTRLVFWEKQIRNDKKPRLAMTAGFGIYEVSEKEIKKRDMKIEN